MAWHSRLGSVYHKHIAYMNIHQLSTEERVEAGLISTVSFHFRVDDMEASSTTWRQQTCEAWGAFDDDGTMMAHINNTRFRCLIDGQVVENGGIGGVSTLPEYRETGAIRGIFQELLPQARQNGEVISTLYPFNPGFYRKFGYETISHQAVWEIPTNAMKGHHHPGWTKMWRPDQPIDDYLALYQQFIPRYNLPFVRDAALLTKGYLHGDCYKDRHFCYLLGEKGSTVPNAYLVCDDRKPTLAVTDLAWNGKAGFHAILGFLSRFSADYGTLSIPLPTDLDLYDFIDNPYQAKKNPRSNYMIRVVNAPKLLEVIAKPADAAFTILVNDSLITENQGTWRVSAGGVERTDAQPDIVVSERALGPLAVGAVTLDSAALRTDVEILGNAAVLSRVFYKKALHINDHF